MEYVIVVFLIDLLLCGTPSLNSESWFDVVGLISETITRFQTSYNETCQVTHSNLANNAGA